MRRGELGESLNLEVEMIPAGRPNRPGTPLATSKITIHNTSNKGRGADAKAHSRWVRETGYYLLADGRKNWVSWHYTVDDLRVIQQLPLNEKGWHAGPGNSKSLGIEICMHQEIDQESAFDRAARLCACLLYDFSLAPDDLVRHREWTGKACPILLMSDDKWHAFRGRAASYLQQIKEATNFASVASPGFQPVMCDEPGLCAD